MPGSEGLAERGGWAIAQFAFNHPTIAGCAGALLALVFISSLTVSGIKFRYPVYHEMPPRARFWLGFLRPLAANFWQFSSRVGLKEPTPPADPPPTQEAPPK